MHSNTVAQVLNAAESAVRKEDPEGPERQILGQVDTSLVVQKWTEGTVDIQGLFGTAQAAGGSPWTMKEVQILTA